MAEDNIPQANQVAIRQMIIDIRGVKVILDRDIAKLYGVTTGNLNKAVKRNIERFPERFMFQLTEEENLLFQNGISTMATGDMGFEGGITQFRQKYPATFQIGLENKQKNFSSFISPFHHMGGRCS